APEPTSAAAGEAQHGPAPLLGHTAEALAGGGGAGGADEVHQGHVLVTVGVEVALRQVDTLLGGEGLHGVGLARAPEDRALDLAAEQAVLEREPVADHVVDPEVGGDRLHT